MRKGENFYVVDITQADKPFDLAKQKLLADGVVVLRGLYSADIVEKCLDGVRKIMSRPALLGATGYYRKGHNKRMYDALLLGSPVPEMVLDERVLDVVSATVGAECWLAECFLKHDEGNNELYFPMHSDFAPGHPKMITDERMTTPFAIGAMLYTHDTTTGAFCYAIGSQNGSRAHGTALARYPKDIQDSVAASLVRIEGKAGDLVLFDDRGFHAPEQPVTVPRTVIILDYYDRTAFDAMTKTPLPVLATDLGRLSRRQIEWLGMGAKGVMLPYERYHVHGFYTQRHYKVLSHVVDWMQRIDVLRSRVKKLAQKFNLISTRQPGYEE